MIPMPCPRQGFALVALLALALAGGTALPARAQGARIDLARWMTRWDGDAAAFRARTGPFRLYA